MLMKPSDFMDFEENVLEKIGLSYFSVLKIIFWAVALGIFFEGTDKFTYAREAILYIGVGLLSFLGIFYALIYQPAIEKKLRKIQTEEQTEFLKYAVSLLSTVTKKLKKIQVEQARTHLEDLQEELDDLTQYLRNINAREALFRSVSLLLAEIFFLVLHVFYPNLSIVDAKGTVYSFFSAGILCLIVGSYYLSKLVLIWHTIYYDG